jgi:tyrosyl-tRNA synthetase
MDLTIDEKYNIIMRDLGDSIVDEEIIKKILAVRPLKIYWGTAPTAPPHIGYFVPLLKIIDFLNAGCHVTILIADLHAMLDNNKSTHKQIESRSTYYITMIQAMLTSLGVNLDQLKFVKGTDFQLSQSYTMDVYKAHTDISFSEAKHASAEVVKHSDNPKLTGLLYPTLQALDEQYLDVDCQFGGVDQRKIFVHARKILPSLGYKKRFYFMNKMVPGLRFQKKVDVEKCDNIEDLKSQIMVAVKENDSREGLSKVIKSILSEETLDVDKMSSSDSQSKINILDSRKQIQSKINKVYCLPGNVEDNSLLPIVERIIFPCLNLKKGTFLITRKIEHGGSIEYKSYDDLVKDFISEKLHPGDLKLGIIENLFKILSPIQESFKSKDMQVLIRKAYP